MLSSSDISSQAKTVQCIPPSSNEVTPEARVVATMAISDSPVPQIIVVVIHFLGYLCLVK
jgi:hypothetical protein